MADVLVALRGATRVFPTLGGLVEALKEASCDLHAGDRIAIMGPSGSGKSTLMALMAGLDEPTQGSVTWPSRDPGRPLRPGYIGVAFQTPSLVPALTAVENVEIPLLVMNDLQDSGRRAMEALAFLDLAHLADRLPDELSGGQSQRVALARALVASPRVLLADEPTGQLDHATARAVIRRLTEWSRGAGKALVIATHDMDVAAQMQQTWHIVHGRLETPATLRLAS